MKVLIEREAIEAAIASMENWSRVDRVKAIRAMRDSIESSAHPDGPTGTEARVCADIARRQEVGVAKYGQTVEENPLALRDWLRHAYEECLDQAVYLRRAIEEVDGGAA